MNRSELVAVAGAVQLAFGGAGLREPKIIIKHWQDWARILSVFPDATWTITVIGIVFEYGGEWPHPADNSDVR
jgi:hypothetical protein